ncbi:pentapeptide repeat-containing protein [Egbenema bharatensis]|uniref:pentapeptide repeat-containing protein n=1 Tax=Egbenema bharatensis TaxID=3463334 RepID=UPI003A853E0B
MSRKKQAYSPSIEPSYSKKAIWSWLGLVVAAIGVVQLQEIVNFLNESISTDSRFQRSESARQDREDGSTNAVSAAGETDGVALEEQAASAPAASTTAPESIRPIEFSQDSQQTILDNYQNLLHALVVEENLKELEQTHPLRIAANQQTVATLNQLNGLFRERLLQFLIDSNLILEDNPTLSLQGATFKQADLRDFELSQMDLSQANLSETSLNRANLSGSQLLNTAFDQADLSFADLSGAELSKASFFHANLFLTNVSNANLQEAFLNSADLFLTNFQNANLSNASIATADLSFANLSQAQLIFTNLSESNLAFANLSAARLTGTDLRRSTLRGANLTDADLGGANLQRADLSEANLTGANLTGADLTGAVFYNTIMPDGSIRN